MLRQLPNDSLNDGKIKEKFRELQGRREGALIAYLTGNDPDPKSFVANATALIEGGADIVEVGIPFSDPIADGPIVQASSMRALSQGATPAGILDRIAELSSQFTIPFVVLSYYNPILAIGSERFLKKVHGSGVNGVVVPDLPAEEAREFGAQALRFSVDNICLAAPNTSRTRLKTIFEESTGFVYLVSLYGVTGPRDSLSPQALETVRVTKALSGGKIPIAAGFGISRAEHVSMVIRSGADGAIVGSALVKIVADHIGNPSEAEEKLKKTVKSLKAATCLS